MEKLIDMNKADFRCIKQRTIFLSDAEWNYFKLLSRSWSERVNFNISISEAILLQCRLMELMEIFTIKKGKKDE